jgi:hypothetical protein
LFGGKEKYIKIFKKSKRQLKTKQANSKMFVGMDDKDDGVVEESKKEKTGQKKMFEN